MLKLWKPELNHEDLFAQRYEQLFDWALRLTDHDRQRAEDILHDTFVQFALSRPNLAEIENLDGYFYTMLKNTRLSQLRRAAYDPQRHLSLLDFDSLKIDSRAYDQLSLAQAQNELRLICRYACTRKWTSKAGSVLILRCFHSYTPGEIAQILQCSRPVVARWMQIARAEAKLYLTNPGDLAFIHAPSDAEVMPINLSQGPGDFLLQLTDVIFEARSGECLSPKEMSRRYRARTADWPDCAALSHIVSCRDCLNSINDLLGLPQLSERHPSDMVDRDRPPKDGSGKGGLGGAKSDNMLRRGRRRVKETFEHRPHELRIAVNGYIVGAQKINSESSEQEVSLNLSEQIGFIEIFSEQRVRLLAFNVEPPPAGKFAQEAQIVLSDERSLKVMLSFTSPWPVLNVVYHDPTFKEAQAATAEYLSGNSSLSLELSESPIESERNLPNRFGQIAMRFGRRSHDLMNFWLRPKILTAIIALLVIATLVMIKWPKSSVSANELLHRSSAGEEALAANVNQAVRRVISLEERRFTDGLLIARRRIEVLSSAERGITARRLYDDGGQLIAGEWKTRDGARTIYTRGSRTPVRFSAQRPISGPIGFGSAWRLDPSAQEFKRLQVDLGAARVEEKPAVYLITSEATGQIAQSDQSNSGAIAVPGLIKATLLLDRETLRALEQTLVMRENGEAREYRYIETTFEQKPVSAVAPAVFEPEPELTGERIGRVAPTSGQPNALLPSTAEQATNAIFSTQLEIGVFALLEQVGADLGQEVIVNRTAGGELKLEATVDSDVRKREILNVLAPVAKHPAIKIEIETAEEAQNRLLKTQPTRQSDQFLATESVISAGEIAVHGDVRSYLMAQGAPEAQMDQEIGRFAWRILTSSHQRMLHVWALRNLVRRFPREELRALNPEARARWLGMISKHAQSVQRRTTALRRELAPVFKIDNEVELTESGGMMDDARLIEAIERLIELATEEHAAVRAAFTVSPNGGNPTAIKNSTFWRSLRSVEGMAVAIERTATVLAQ